MHNHQLSNLCSSTALRRASQNMCGQTCSTVCEVMKAETCCCLAWRSFWTTWAWIYW